MSIFQSLKRRNRAVLITFLLAACFPGCVAPPPALPIASPTTPSASATPHTTATPTVALATPTLLSAPTPTHTPTRPPVTPRPTLTADEKFSFAREMLETNAGCELPCWWGVTPGETRWETVPEIFGAYGITGHLYQNSTLSYAFTLPLGEHRLHHLGFHFTQQQGVVDRIWVHSSTADSSNSLFAQDWQRYAPYQVLARYGEPLQVDLHIVPWTPEYTLGLAYEHLGFFIVYGGTPTRISPTTMRVCFDFAQVNFVALSLRSPQPEAAPQEGVARPLEEVTEMDIETFYALLRDPDSDICFETPTELWP